jgi:large subunit ribosomal protein L24
MPALDKVLVKGINIAARHRKSKEAGKSGEILRKEAPLHISNVMLLCKDTNKPTRVGFRMEGGEKVRFSKKSGKAIA